MIVTWARYFGSAMPLSSHFVGIFLFDDSSPFIIGYFTEVCLFLAQICMLPSSGLRMYVFVYLVFVDDSLPWLLHQGVSLFGSAMLLGSELCMCGYLYFRLTILYFRLTNAAND